MFDRQINEPKAIVLDGIREILRDASDTMKRGDRQDMVDLLRRLSPQNGPTDVNLLTDRQVKVRAAAYHIIMMTNDIIERAITRNSFEDLEKLAKMGRHFSVAEMGPLLSSHGLVTKSDEEQK